MTRLVTISRAAKLVGISRGTLQRRVQDGEIESFEGMLDLEQLSQLYPQAAYEDNTILEKLDRIIEHAAHRARNRTTTLSPDMETLAARVGILSDELVEAKLEISIFYNIFDKLKSKLEKNTNLHPESASLLHELKAWLITEIDAISDRKFQTYPLIATDTILRIVAAQVHLLPSNHEFFVEGSNTILESGLSAGLAMSYGCSNGNCGKCKARLVSGEIKKVRSHDYVLTEKEKLQGYFLPCAHTAVTDIVMEADEAGSENDIPMQSLAAWVRKNFTETPQLHVLQLKTPRTERLRFLAGQMVKLEIPGIASRTLHIASCPCDDMNLRFMIEKHDNDKFSDYIFDQIKTNEIVNIEGPYGHFVLHEDEPNPIIFIAFASGFAPVMSLIEHAMTLDVTEYIYLYRIVPGEEFLYQHNQCRAWDDAFERFRYTPVILDDQKSLSEAIYTISAEHESLDDYHFYVAGLTHEVNEIKNTLQKQGVNPGSIFTEQMDEL